MVNRSCQTCHRFSEEELLSRAHEIQSRFMEARNRGFDAIVALINDLKAAREQGRSENELATARDLQRKAQFLLDFVEAENSTGFHAPGEALRLLTQVIDFSRQGQLALKGVQVMVSPGLTVGDPSPVKPDAGAPLKSDAGPTPTFTLGVDAGIDASTKKP